jgi:C1A family cysteine protease
MSRPEKWSVLTESVPADTQRAPAGFVDPVTPPAAQRRHVAPRPPAFGLDALTEWDWRTHHCLSVPRDQGPSNTCTAFALAAAIEARCRVQKNASLSLAPGYIHTCLLGYGPERGVWGGDALDAVVANGVARAFPGDYPYPPAQCQTGDVFRLDRYQTIDAEAGALQATIRGPLVADMDIEPSMLQLKPGEVYRYQDSPARRLHSVALVGFNASKRYWIVQNSWGSGWCDGGFGLVAFGSGGLLVRRCGWEPLLN